MINDINDYIDISYIIYIQYVYIYIYTHRSIIIYVNPWCRGTSWDFYHVVPIWTWILGGSRERLKKQHPNIIKHHQNLRKQWYKVHWNWDPKQFGWCSSVNKPVWLPDHQHLVLQKQIMYLGASEQGAYGIPKKIGLRLEKCWYMLIMQITTGILDTPFSN